MAMYGSPDSAEQVKIQLIGNRFLPSGGVGPESKAESVRFHGTQSDKVDPEVKLRLPQALGA